MMAGSAGKGIPKSPGWQEDSPANGRESNSAEASSYANATADKTADKKATADKTTDRCTRMNTDGTDGTDCHG